MKCYAIVMLLLLGALPSAFANVLPAGQDCEEFMIGVTGIHADIKGGVLRVTKVTSKTPAYGALKEGDELLAVDGTSLNVQDPRHPLGFAINEAEGRDGKMKFSIRRDEEEKEVEIQLEAIGSYSQNFPADCEKSKRIVKDTADFIIKQGGPSGGINGDLEALFLLSTGEKKYLRAVKKYVRAMAERGTSASVWGIGYSGILLGEYYLATGDRKVLPALEARCNALRDSQYYGAWGHYTNHCGPGYVTGGLLNAAGAQSLTTLILARECGVKVDEKTYDDALRFFFRFAARGGVPYGDHFPEYWWASNGKNGGLASALILLPDKKFQTAAQLLVLSETDTYFDSESGHGSTFGNQTWRNIVDVNVPEEHWKSYRRHKKKMIWHLELSRMPDGGFKVPYYPGHGVIGGAPLHQTGLLAMAYTAHLRNLRICGKKRTKYSKEHRPTEVEKSLPMTDFHRINFIDDVVITEEPHHIADIFTALYDGQGNRLPHKAHGDRNDPRKKRMPVEWYAKMMRHYSPQVRTWAAHGLGYQGEPAIPEIKKALASKDARLRTAGMEAISCTLGWGIGKTTSNITSAMIKAHFLPQLLKSLDGTSIPMWEKRHALMALSRCDTETIKANLDSIVPYLDSDEWWLRASAFAALFPLIPETEVFRSVLPAMLSSYHGDSHLSSRRWGAKALFKRAIETNSELKDEIVAGMAKSAEQTEIREGYKQIIDTNNVYEMLRFIDMARHPEHAIPLIPTVERIFSKTGGGELAWLITGEQWGNIGFAKAAEKLGKDGEPFIASMKRLRPALQNAMRKAERKEGYQQALEVLKTSVETWEAEFGKVSID